MEARPFLPATDDAGTFWANSDLAAEPRKALDSGNLKYALVKAV
ncbi:hypothetical protein ACIPUC_17875 [Streptomyces sp. LARHCF249]